MAKHIFYFVIFLFCAQQLPAQSFANSRSVPAIDTGTQITALAVDEDNNKFVGTENGLYRVSAEGLVEIVLPGTKIQAVAWHKRVGLWVGVDGNKLYNPETETSIVLGDDEVHIHSMALSGSQLWVGTNNGVYVVSPSSEVITDHFTSENSKMASDQVNVVYVDESSIKWVGTDKGVARIVNDKWKTYEKQAKITAITGNVEGVWIASDEEMWLVDPYNRWAPTGVSDGLSQGVVRALAADKKGKIYILSETFVQFDPYNDQVVEMENQYAARPDAQVALICDLDDNLWVGSLEYGLVAMELEPAEQKALEAFVTVRHPICFGSGDGSIAIQAEGGNPPYAYQWSPAEVTGRNPQSLGAGDYGLTVTDVKGQDYTLNIRLEEPQELIASIEPIQQITQAGMADGILRANVKGGTGGVDFAWSGGISGRTLENAGPGAYQLLITDDEGCTASASYDLQDGPPPPEPEVEETPVITPEPEIPVREEVEIAVRDTVVAEIADTAPETTVRVEEPEPIPADTSEETVVAEPTEEPAIDAVDTEVLKKLDARTLALGQTLRIEQLYFDADSTDIRPESYEVLDEVFAFLSNNQGIAIEIGGHTNGLPDHVYCDRLSTARAKSVADYLYQRGIPEARILYKGYGKRNPIATNETSAGRKKNQRVEIKILQI